MISEFLKEMDSERPEDRDSDIALLAGLIHEADKMGATKNVYLMATYLIAHGVCIVRKIK